MNFSEDINLNFFLEYVIEWLLPSDSAFYYNFKKLITTKIFIGEGRWGKGDFLLGDELSQIDLNEGMQPIVAYGEIEFTNQELTFSISVAIHEPNLDGIVELQISPDFFDYIYIGFSLPAMNEFDNTIFGDFKIKNKWTYSNWRTSQNCPATNNLLRVVKLNETDLYLVISTYIKSIWVYDSIAQNNIIIPLTAFYNTLMLYKEVNQPSRVLNPKLLFTELKLYSDTELRNAFVLYNKEKKRFSDSRFLDNEKFNSDNSVLNKFKQIFTRKS